MSNRRRTPANREGKPMRKPILHSFHGFGVFFGFVLAMWSSARPAWTATWIVAAHAGDYTSIQAALDAAASGDTIVISPGTYVENLVMPAFVALTIRGMDPNAPAVVEATIIDGGQAGPVITLAGTETSTTLIAGLTLTNGKAVNGGGVLGGYGQATLSK